MTTKSVYDMTDEELMKLSPSEIAAMEENTPDADEEDTTTETTEDNEEDAQNGEVDETKEDKTPEGTQVAQDDEEEEDDGKSEDAPAPTEDDDDSPEVKEPEQKPVNGTQKQPEKEVEESGTGKTQDTASLGFSPEEAQEAVRTLLGPIRASGRDIQVKSVADARSLIEMGVNYSDKMRALKPNLAILKLLEKNELLDADKLNYLIDIHQKNPQAINKLIKDSGIDPMDIDGEKAKDYAPTNRTVTDQEVLMDQVLEDLRNSEHYGKLVTAVGHSWDEASRNVIGQNPGMLKIIHNHIKDGYFDKITEEIANERMLGRLTGISDFEAYRQTGDRMFSEGKFNGANRPADDKTTTQPIRETLKTAPTSTSKKTADLKKKVSPTRSASGSGTKVIQNPLDMSDEEFSKIGGINYLKA